MDSLLVFGKLEDKLSNFLKKMGYSLLSSDEQASVPRLVQKNEIDLIILDARLELDAVELCNFLRAEESTKEVPILCLTDPVQAKQKSELAEFNRVELVDLPYRAGQLVSKIATQLRLRKIRGKDEESASIGEINARLRDLNSQFKSQLEEARAIQLSLVPGNLPDDNRFDLAISYDQLEEVGGDWYYVEKLSTGKIAVQIADVTGHGLSAAFIGSMTKLALHAAKSELPSVRLKEMNELMSKSIPAGKFVTMFSYLYNPESGELHYARAGHPPALLLKRSTGEVKQLKGSGFAIGFFEDSEYSAEQEKLEINDILMIFTDCLPESQNRSGQTYDYDRASKVLLESDSEKSSAEIMRLVLDDFDAFRDGRLLKDDATVIVLKRNK